MSASERQGGAMGGSLLSARAMAQTGPGPDNGLNHDHGRSPIPGSLLSATPAARAQAGNGSAFLPGLSAIGMLGIDDFLIWLYRGRGWIIGAILLCTLGALAYALTATPRYTVHTDIIVDPANLNIVDDDVFAASSQRDAQLMEVESKMRVLTSRNVLARVIERLRLTEDEEFVKPDMLAPLKALLGLRAEEGDATLAAMRGLSERVDARREERSFVVVLSVWSEEPDKAVRISEAVAAAFEEELFRSAAESAGRVADNLSQRLDELRRNVTEAERRVEEFRSANGLQSSSTGELVSNQLSAELNTQVLGAQQQLIEARSRHSQMNAALARGEAASADIFDSQAMNGLRTQRNTLQQQIGSIDRTYGPQHPRMIAALSERASLDSAMEREARRILELARLDLAREQAAFDALSAKAGEERANVFTDNAALVQLRDLEREARSHAAIYETYLARARQVGERQQLDATNVRVISAAVPPMARSWPPRTLFLLAAGAIFGAMAGFAIAIGLGLWRYLRSPQPRLEGQPLSAAA
jgi:uncharacterized protein involved in exopolysaccharide biosynthesis